MLMRVTWVVAMALVVFGACGSDEDGDTQVAVRNNGTATIDAVVSDGQSELHFDGVAAGTTSTFQIATFGTLSGITVRVANATSTISLTEGKTNVVSVGMDGKVSGVTVPVSVGSEGGGW